MRQDCKRQMNRCPIQVAFATDRHFIHHTTIALYSLLAQSTRPVVATILFDDVAEADREKLLLSCEKVGHKIDFVQVDAESISDLPVMSPRMSRAAYFRLLLPEVLQHDIETVLYLDSDILCLGDIAPLWEIDISNRALGAVREPVYRPTNSFLRWRDIFPGRQAVRRLHLAEYFNSGVLLINMRRWREQRISERTLAWRRDGRNLTRLHDQDALNATVGGDWAQLSARWNFGPTFLARTQFGSKRNRKQLDPIIVHFCGSMEWIGRANRNLYRQYVRDSEWAGSARAFFPFLPRWNFKSQIKSWLRGVHIACFPDWYGPSDEFGLAPDK